MIFILSVANRLGSIGLRFVLLMSIARAGGLDNLALYGYMAGAASLVPPIFGFGKSLPLTRMARQHMKQVIDLLKRNWIVSFVACAASGMILLWSGNTGLALFAIAVAPFQLPVADLQNMLANAGLNAQYSIVYFIRNVVSVLFSIALINLLHEEHIMLSIIAPWALCDLLALGASWYWARGMPQSSDEAKGTLDVSPVNIGFYLSDIMGGVSVYIDRFVLGLLLTSAVVGTYFFAWSFGNTVYTVLYFGFYMNIRGSMIEAAKEKDFSKLRRHVQLLVSSSIFLYTMFVFGVVGFCYIFERWVFAREIIMSRDLILATGLIMAMRFIADSQSFALYALGDKNYFVSSNLGAGFLSIAGNCALVPFFGAYGSILSAILVNLLLFFYRLHGLRRYGVFVR